MGRPANERFCYYVLPMRWGAIGVRYMVGLYHREEPNKLESENPAEWFKVAAIQRFDTAADCLEWVRTLIWKFDACDIWAAASRLKRPAAVADKELVS